MANFYAVAVGRRTGVVDSWDLCKELTDGYKGAMFKGVSTEEKGREYIASVQGASFEAKKEELFDKPKWTPRLGETYYYPCFTQADLIDTDTWSGDLEGILLRNSGMVFMNMIDAREAAVSMLAVLKKTN